MIEQARIGDTVLVRGREMTGKSQTQPVAGDRRGKGDRKLTVYAPMIYTAPCVRFLIWADRLIQGPNFMTLKTGS